MKRTPMLLLFAVAMLSTGCATIICGSHEDICIDSIPHGQTVIVNGRDYTTPVVVPLRRAANHQVQFPNGTVIKIGSIGWPNFESFLNLLILPFGLLPYFVAIIVDMSTGATRNLEPDYLGYHNGLIYDLEVGRGPDAVIGGNKEGTHEGSDPYDGQKDNWWE